MPLLTKADLQQPQAYLTPYLESAQFLSQAYYDYVSNNQDEGYSYTVEVSGGKGRAPGIHASEMSNCLRQVVYSLLNVERKADSSTSDVNMLMRFAMGTAVHSLVQSDWHRIAERTRGLWTIAGVAGCTMTFEDEVEVSPVNGGAAADWDLHSHCDGVFTFWAPDNTMLLRVGLEIKTASDKVFSKLTKPEKYHLEQTTLYMAALDLPLMWVFYYNKSNSNITTSYAPYLFQFDPKLWETLEMRFAQAHHLANTRQLPPGTEGMPCGWCPWSYTCQPKILKGKQPKRTTLSVGMKRRIRR